MLERHVKHFLEFFRSADSVNTFCWMDESTSKVVRGRGTVFGKLENLPSWEKEIGRMGIKNPTLHITLNETNTQGRKRGDISSYRVLCCDLDYKISEDKLLRIYKKYKVQMVVRSSPGKYHLYWKLERGSDLELWSKLQLGIAQRLDGDLQLSLPTSMIRVPGFVRITKDGSTFLPSVMAFADENKSEVLSIKKIVKMWPWIWEEGEKGEKTLKDQRREAARIAHEMMRSRGKEYDPAKFAAQTPNVGRNITLYHAIYEVVYAHEEKLTPEEVLSYGEDLNNSFKVPLGQAEVRKTVDSAYRHGMRARGKKIRERRELVSVLEHEERAVEQKEKKESSKEINALVCDAILGTEVVVPDSYLSVSDTLVKRIWLACSKGVQTHHHNILASAYKTKYYRKLGEFLMEHLKMCGAFKVSGYSVYLKGVNAGGSAVRYRKNLDTESMSSLVQDVLSRLYLYAVRVSLNGHGGPSSDSLINHLEGSGDGTGTGDDDEAGGSKKKGDSKKKSGRKVKGKVKEKTKKQKAKTSKDSQVH